MQENIDREMPEEEVRYAESRLYRDAVNLVNRCIWWTSDKDYSMIRSPKGICMSKQRMI